MMETELSYRERQVIDLALQGKRPKEIADILHISGSTVGTHMDRIRHKKGILIPGQIGLIIGLVGYEREELKSALRSAKSLLDRAPQLDSASWLMECQDIATCIERVL